MGGVRLRFVKLSLIGAICAFLCIVDGFAAGATIAKQSVPDNVADAPVVESSRTFGVSGYAAFAVVSGYAYRGSLLNDEPCYWTYGELNATYLDVLSVGGWFFQNTDMTCRQKEMMRRMNEWDFGVDVRGRFEIVEKWRICAEVGHAWSRMHGLKEMYADYYGDGANSLYAILWVENPYVEPFVTLEYEYKLLHGGAVTGGLRRKLNLPFDLELTPSVALGGGSGGYNEFLYPPFDDSIGTAFTYARVGADLVYWFLPCCGVRLQVAYSVTLDGDVRDAIDRMGHPYRKDFVWGSAGLCFSF